MRKNEQFVGTEMCVVPCSALVWLWESCLNLLRFHFLLCKVGVVIITLTFRVVSRIQENIFEKVIYELFTIWHMLDFTFSVRAWLLSLWQHCVPKSLVASLGSILMLQYSSPINMSWSHFRWFQLRGDLWWSSYQEPAGTGRGVLLCRSPRLELHQNLVLWRWGKRVQPHSTSWIPHMHSWNKSY